jgi:hypothetical protein
MKNDIQEMIIDIILNSDFFPNKLKNEVRNFKNWGDKIINVEFQYHYQTINQDSMLKYGPTKFNTLKTSEHTTILKWSSGLDTILPMINKDLITFNWFDEIIKYREGIKNE